MITFDPTLATRALAGPGADVAESLLREIQDLSDRSEYLAAAKRAAGALRDGGTDIRVLASFLLGVFLEQGPESLPTLLRTLHLAISDRWLSVRPEIRKAKVTDSVLSGLFRAIVVQIDFHAKLEDATFRVWARAGAATVGQPGLKASADLWTAIDTVIEKARSTVQLSEVEVRIRALFNRVEAARPIAVVTPELPAPGDEEEAQSDDVPAPSVRDPAVGVHHASSAARTLEISPAMELLLRKLAAFETLVARGDLERAAVVAEDVRSTLDSFDPRVYLPRIFSSYARVLATYVNDIAFHSDSIGSPTWRALDQLYRIDLDAFLAK
ncbi:MAG: type VI secretion system protein IglI family protein [Byssovorax sp.]